MRKITIIISLAACIFYFILNYVFISYFHFHEDAYIMFRYVEMFVQGHGVTYYPGGEHIEGATDFLWFILLSILNFIHIDVGIASILLNSMGVFMITYCMTEIILTVKNNIIQLLLLPLVFAWLLFVPVLAALGGFSVFLYSGFIILTLHLLNKGKNITWIPVLSILIALFRPDGVILGSCFTLIGLYFCEKGEWRKYFINIAIAVLIGSIYFICRYVYFGELLPLPLYVKQSSDIWFSLNKNISEANTTETIFGIILFFICFLVQNKINKKKIFILTIPLIAFFSILSLAHQSQNIASRFQAPIIYMGYYLIIVMIVTIIKEYKKYGYLFLVIFYILIGTSAYYNMYKYAVLYYIFNKKSYIDVFPKKLADSYVLEDGDTIALTEAGRLAYWMGNKPIKIIDFIGLNTKYTAKHELTAEYIDKINPDIMMAFINTTFEGEENVYWIKDKKLAEKSILIDEKIKHLNEYSVDKEGQVMIVIGAYILDHWDEYDLFYVRFLRDRFPHVYALKKNKNKSELFYKLLKDSFNNHKSYLDLKNE